MRCTLRLEFSDDRLTSHPCSVRLCDNIWSRKSGASCSGHAPRTSHFDFEFSHSPTYALCTQDHVPFEADMTVPPNPDLSRLCASSDFITFNERIKREYEVALTPIISASGGASGPSIFRFRCQRSNSDCLATAREMLEAFLMSKHVHVYAQPVLAVQKPVVDSFADSLRHFNSKLLSTSAISGGCS